jgi:hypothetical protein
VFSYFICELMSRRGLFFKGFFSSLFDLFSRLNAKFHLNIPEPIVETMKVPTNVDVL